MRGYIVAAMAPDFFRELEEDATVSDWQPQASGILEKVAAELLAKTSGKG